MKEKPDNDGKVAPHVSPSLEQIIGEFSGTIFWNNVFEWPGKKGDEPDEPMAFTVIDPVPAGYNSNTVDHESILVRAGFGELDVDVAILPPQVNDADMGNISSKADAHFIAQLPIYMPILLAKAKLAEELLAACVMLVESQSGDRWIIGNVALARDMAKAAIAKAEGN